MEYKGLADICRSCLCSVKTCPSFSLLSPFSRPHYLLFSPTVVPVPSWLSQFFPSLLLLPSCVWGKWEGRSQWEAQTQPATQQQRERQTRLAGERAEAMACSQDLERAEDNSTHRLKKENGWK